MCQSGCKCKVPCKTCNCSKRHFAAIKNLSLKDEKEIDKC